MSQSIVLKQGLDVPITGQADLRVSKTVSPGIVAVKPTDFKGLLPRLLVKEGDRVLAGSPVLADKKNPAILVASPASGVVKEIVRGEKRKLLAVIVETDEQQEYLELGAQQPDRMTSEQVKEAILKCGLWPWIIQRPYGIIANPESKPKAIFVSGFDTAPLAADVEFTLGSQAAYVQAGINAISKLTDGGVHLSLNSENAHSSAFHKLEGVVMHEFAGKHPAGNVGVQISHICPVRKDMTVWTVSLLGLATIGKVLTTGRYDVRRKVAVAGPMAIEPSYVETLPGSSVKEFAGFYGSQTEGIRFIDGNVLSGTSVGSEGFLGFYSSLLTLIKEGTDKELLGWIRPIRYKQFSTDHSYFSWLTPWRKYDMTTNLHGGVRAFMMNDGYYKKVLPMDIYPIYLAKACLAGDIEKMEKFGIYEVLPEDLALCEFVDPSKNDIQEMIARGIDLMLKEMA